MPLRWKLVLLLSAMVGLLMAQRAIAAPQQTHTVVFVSPASEELDVSLHDALTAQLSGSAALLVFERFTSEGGSLRHQVSDAQSLASAHDAVGVFWLDAQSEHDWLIYLAEPTGERVLVRRMEVEPGGIAAAVEAVAVITRESAEALLAGQTIGMQPVQLPPEPASPEPTPTHGTPAPARARVPAHGLDRPSGPAISIAYYGDSLAREVSWQSGVRFGGSFHAASGLYAGAGYVFYREANVDVPDLSFQITRTPFDVEAGFAFGHGRFIPAVELRSILDVVRRHTVPTATSFQPTPDAARVVIFLSPRLRLDYTLSAVLGIYVEGGADVALNDFSFVSRIDGSDHRLLTPPGIRPAVELGGTFWP